MKCSRREFIVAGVVAGLGSAIGVLTTLTGCQRAPSELAAGRVTVIPERCIGCVRCVNVAPTAYRMNRDGKAEVIEDAPLDAALLGVRACPEDAIEVKESARSDSASD